MNIYSINYVAFDGFYLSAAVVAKSEKDALELVNLDYLDATEISVTCLGIANDGVEAGIISHESL